MLDKIEEEEEEEASNESSLEAKFLIRGFEVVQETRPTYNLLGHVDNHFLVHALSSLREKSWI